MAIDLLLIDSNKEYYFFPLYGDELLELENNLKSEKIKIEYWESDYNIISDMIEKNAEIKDLEKINDFINDLEWSIYGKEILNTYYDLGAIKNLNMQEIGDVIENSIYYDIENYIESNKTYEEVIGTILIKFYGHLKETDNAKEFIDYKKICEDALSEEWYLDNDNHILVNIETI